MNQRNEEVEPNSGRAEIEHAQIFRVGDRIAGTKHLAYAATNPAFCGRVGGGPSRQWRTFCDAALPLPHNALLCRECAQSGFNGLLEQTK